MKLTIKDFNPSETIKKLNPELFGAAPLVAALRPEVTEPRSLKTLVYPAPRKKNRRTRATRSNKPMLRVGLIAVVNRNHDLDNIVAGFKALRDKIAADFGCDDAESWIEWSYGQIHRPGEAGTIVIVEKL